MDAYYANEEAPAAEEVYVIGRATTPAERRCVDKALTKFELRDGRYFHKRAEEELASFRERSKAGAENADKRWQKNAKRNANPMPTACQTTSEVDASEMLASSHKPVISPSLRSGEKRRGTRLPPEFVMPEDWKTWALKQQPTWTPQHLQATADNFRDYWVAAPKGVKLDWLATWRQWVRKESPMRGAPIPAAQSTAKSAKVIEEAAAAKVARQPMPDSLRDKFVKPMPDDLASVCRSEGITPVPTWLAEWAMRGVSAAALRDLISQIVPRPAHLSAVRPAIERMLA